MTDEARGSVRLNVLSDAERAALQAWGRLYNEGFTVAEWRAACFARFLVRNGTFNEGFHRDHQEG